MYKIGRTLGIGATSKVKLGIDKRTGEKVAIKVMNKAAKAEWVTAEITILESIEYHPNIINLIHHGHDIYQRKNGLGHKTEYMVLELVDRGELHDFLNYSDTFSEPLARYFFKQLMNGLNHIHTSGITHRDLKLENLMFDNDFTLKIVDFGSAAPLGGWDGSGKLTEQIGTQTNMAPEMFSGSLYSGEKIDIFAAGIILFRMLAKIHPFAVLSNNTVTKNFWENHDKNGISTDFNDSLKHLLSNMFIEDPLLRPTYDKIMAHQWVNVQTMTKDEVYREMSYKQEMVDEAV